MTRAAQVMTAYTQAANAAAGLADGSAERRAVTITGIRQIGMVNFDLLLEIDLMTVPLGGGMPYPATTQQSVGQMLVARLQPGVSLPASVALANPATIWLDRTTLG